MSNQKYILTLFLQSSFIGALLLTVIAFIFNKKLEDFKTKLTYNKTLWDAKFKLYQEISEKIFPIKILIENIIKNTLEADTYKHLKDVVGCFCLSPRKGMLVCSCEAVPAFKHT